MSNIQVLEKILGEIKAFKRKVVSENQDYQKGYLCALSVAEGIIAEHMNEAKDTDVPTNNGWIPCSERLPEESLNSVIGWDMYRERCVFVQYRHGRWIFGNDIEPVLITAWMTLPKRYKPVETKLEKNTQQEMEDFWRDK